jgi:hypothetical protein
MARQITPEERALLLKIAPTFFNDHGVTNHERARYARLISEEVLASPVPAFLPLQPKIKMRESTAWIQASQIVVAFLDGNQMENTLHSLRLECRNSREGEVKLQKCDGFEGNSDDFQKLVRFLHGISHLSFLDRAAGYAKFTEYADLAQDVDVIQALTGRTRRERKSRDSSEDIDFNADQDDSDHDSISRLWDEEEAIDELGNDSDVEPTKSFPGSMPPVGSGYDADISLDFDD